MERGPKEEPMARSLRLPGFLLNQIAFTGRLERLQHMSAIAAKYGSVEGVAQIEDLAERVDGINQMVFDLDDEAIGQQPAIGVGYTEKVYPLRMRELDEDGRVA